MSLVLYYVRADHPEATGENADLLVWARDTDDARALWRAYFDLSDYADPLWVGSIPLTPVRGAVNWNRIYPEEAR